MYTQHFTQEMKDSFTSALLKAICDRLKTCSEESDIGLRESTIVCPNSDSKIGILFATISGTNATKMVESIKQVSDNLAVDLGNGLSLSLCACDVDCPTAKVYREPIQSSGLVAGTVISVIFLVAMVIAAAILLTVIIFKHQ